MTISSAWEQAFASRDRRPIADWAHDRLDLRPPYTITGPFDVGITRHFLAPLDALHDDYCPEVNILKPVRSGGSLLGDLHFANVCKEDPGPYLSVFQTDKIAREHGEERLEQHLRHLGLLPSGNYKWDSIELTNGHKVHTNGPSLNNLQSIPFRYIRLDEIWLYDGILSEAEGRLGDYKKQGNYKLVVVSQGGPMPGGTLEQSDWHRHYHFNSEIHEWETACLGCGGYFMPKFFDVRTDGKTFAGICWDKEKNTAGKLNAARALQTVRFECPLCGHPHTDFQRTRTEWNRLGRYRLTTESNRRKKCFHWEAVIDFPWVELVSMWLSACEAFESGNVLPKLQFYQKYCARHMDEKALLESNVRLPRVSYEISTGRADGELGRCMTVDKQDEDTYWYQVRAWFAGGRSRRLAFGRAHGYEELEAIRIKWGVAPNNLLIDSAFESKGHRGVYAACLRNRWIALRGEDKPFFWHGTPKGRVMRSYSPLSQGDPEIGTALGGRRFAPLIFFSKPTYNKRVQELIDCGKWEEPTDDGSDMEREYKRQMASRMERVEYNRKTNAERRYWWEGKNDHARDLANFQVLFATLAKILPDNLEQIETQNQQ